MRMRDLRLGVCGWELAGWSKFQGRLSRCCGLRSARPDQREANGHPRLLFWDTNQQPFVDLGRRQLLIFINSPLAIGHYWNIIGSALLKLLGVGKHLRRDVIKVLPEGILYVIWHLRCASQSLDALQRFRAEAPNQRSDCFLIIA